MKTQIASIILSAMAVMAVVSGFILPNQGSIGGVHRQRQLQKQQIQFDHRISSENLLSTTTRLFMSETSTRTFERREGGGPSSYGGRGGRGRGGKFGFKFSFFTRGDVCSIFVVDAVFADPFALLLGSEYLLERESGRNWFQECVFCMHVFFHTLLSLLYANHLHQL
jgi:hypothetical protein